MRNNIGAIIIVYTCSKIVVSSLIIDILLCYINKFTGCKIFTPNLKDTYPVIFGNN
jgi:hypothetical protein